MSLVASTANSDGWVQIPCTLSNGVSVSKPIILNFDSGAQFSAMSQRVADAAGVTKFVGTEGFKGIGTMEAVTKIAQVVLTVNGSAPFTTYVDVDPQLTEPGLISRQDITRVARVCITPQGYSFTPFSMAQTQPSRTPKSTPVTPAFVAPETNPTPSRIK